MKRSRNLIVSLIICVLFIMFHFGCKSNPAGSGDPGTRIGAVCRDGTRTTQTGEGACAADGGVDHWLYGIGN